MMFLSAQRPVNKVINKYMFQWSSNSSSLNKENHNREGGLGTQF